MLHQSDVLGLKYNFMDICDKDYSPANLMCNRKNARRSNYRYDLDSFQALSLFYGACYNDSIVYRHSQLKACKYIEDSLLEMFMRIHTVVFQELVSKVISPGINTFSNMEDRLLIGMALRVYHFYYVTEVKNAHFTENFWLDIKRNLNGNKKQKLYRYLKRIMPIDFKYRDINISNLN